MRLNIVSAGVISLEGKLSEKESIQQSAKAFGEFADIDFCVDESDDTEIVLVGTYHKHVQTIQEIREMWSRFKFEKNKNL